MRAYLLELRPGRFAQALLAGRGVGDDPAVDRGLERSELLDQRCHPSSYSSWRRIQSCQSAPSSRPFGARSRIG